MVHFDESPQRGAPFLAEQRFLPEVILSIRVDWDEELNKTHKSVGEKSRTTADGIAINRAWKSEKIRVHSVKIDRKKIANICEKKLIPHPRQDV